MATKKATSKTSKSRKTRTTRRPAQQNYSGLAIVLGALLIAAIAFSFGSITAPLNAPARATENVTVYEPKELPVEPANIEAPAAQDAASTLVITDNGKQVTLQLHPAAGYYYETTIDGNSHDLRFTLPEGMAFALDADNAMGLERQNALNDVLLFGDKTGEYSIWGVYAGGLRIMPYGQAPDLAGPALRDRAKAGAPYQCPRPVYYVHVDESGVTQVESSSADPFTGTGVCD